MSFLHFRSCEGAVVVRLPDGQTSASPVQGKAFGAANRSRAFLGGCGHLDDLKVGSIVFQTAACKVLKNRTTGFLGLEFFQGFDAVTFDCQHSELVFLPNPSSTTPLNH